MTACTAPEKPQPFKCNHQTPLENGIPGSPDNLIMLENRPSGVTELAALMREMLEAMKERRSQIIEKKPVQALKNYERMKCAWPTDMNNRSAQFDALADFTIQAIDHFNDKPSEDSYNTVVASCITCHQQRCPGPMAAIRPLVLDNGETLQPVDVNPESCETPLEQKSAP